VAAQRSTGRPRRATIIDVARLSGVSKSTVSNVVHGAAPVHPDTRAQVLRAIQELGYRPNALARDLKRQRSAMVGVVVGDLSNPFYAELTKLIEQHTASAGYATILCAMNGPTDAERDKIALLLEQQVAGILTMFFGGDAAALDEVTATGVPIVGVSVDDARFDCVVADDALGARLAVRHLAELGHTRIAYVPSHATEASTNAARLEGWKQALRRSRLRRGPIVTLADEPGEDRLVPLAQAMQDVQAPTAYFAGNDITALQVIDRLESAGIAVPRDASVVGFDDIGLSSLGRLSLTTLRQPVADIAALGVSRLLKRVDGDRGAGGRAKQTRLQPELIVRATTASAPG
jgi:DNA-binding LacI/PurR family transcriptional regulator